MIQLTSTGVWPKEPESAKCMRIYGLSTGHSLSTLTPRPQALDRWALPMTQMIDDGGIAIARAKVFENGFHIGTFFDDIISDKT